MDHCQSLHAMYGRAPFGRGETSDEKGVVIDKSESESSSDSDHDHHQDNKLMEDAASNLVALKKSEPMKGGLSSHYDGNPKSFDNLLDIKLNDISELGKKKEDPLNKKRLTLSHDDLNMPSFNNVPIQGIPVLNNMPTLDLDSISNEMPVFPSLPSNNASASNEDTDDDYICMDDLSDREIEVGFEDYIWLDDLNIDVEIEYNHDCISLDDLSDGQYFDGDSHDDEENKEDHNSAGDQSDRRNRRNKDDEHHDDDEEENNEINLKST